MLDEMRAAGVKINGMTYSAAIKVRFCCSGGFETREASHLYMLETCSAHTGCVTASSLPHPSSGKISLARISGLLGVRSNSARRRKKHASHAGKKSHDIDGQTWFIHHVHGLLVFVVLAPLQ